jgi:hypothetical protein
MALVRQQQLGQQAAMQRVRVLVFDQHQVVLDEEVTLAPVIRWAAKEKAAPQSSREGCQNTKGWGMTFSLTVWRCCS